MLGGEKGKWERRGEKESSKRKERKAREARNSRNSRKSRKARDQIKPACSWQWLMG